MNLPPKTYIIEAEEAESMAKSKNLTLPQLLPSLIKSAQTLANPPISNFAVGVVGLTSDGRIFFGGNIEFPGLPLHHTIHGEQFFITNLAAHAAGAKLLYLAVSAAPCGHCRQFFQELRGISDTQIVITDQPQENPDYKPFSSILPHPFGPFDLLDENTPLILEKQNNQLTLKDGNFIIQDEKTCDLPNGFSDLNAKNEGFLKTEASAAARGSHVPPKDGNFINQDENKFDLSNGFCELVAKNEEFLKSEALAAARGSHAPYSGCPSGVALMDCEGKVYKGSYMESAAYNPSMMPVQAALVAYMVAGGGGYERIVAAVVVEKEGVVVRQEDTARLVLKHLSPKCEFRVVYCN
ncbi:putative cytidine deaminase [Helianthus debilis subsp. tardiflorus]